MTLELRLGARQASHKYMHNNVTRFILRPTSAQNVPRPGADVILLTAGRSIHNAASAVLHIYTQSSNMRICQITLYKEPCIARSVFAV